MALMDSVRQMMQKISYFCSVPVWLRVSFDVLQVSGTSSSRSDSVIDSSLYLDCTLRARLLAEHAVQCCTIVQRLGDIVLVPAMSPYQVCQQTS